MANKITYPIVGGVIKNMKGNDANIAAGDYVAVSADNTVDTAASLVHGIALDAPKAGVSPSASYTVSVLLFGNGIVKAPAVIAGSPSVGDYLKGDGSGGLTKETDGAIKTGLTLALLLDATNRVILIL